MAIKSLKQLFARMPDDGVIRHELRNFNLGMMGAKRHPSVVELCRKVGVPVDLVDLPTNFRGRLVHDTFADRGFRIEINANDSVVARRWTVLHELMHLLLHSREDPFADNLYRASSGHFYLRNELAEERDANDSVEALVFGDGALEAAISLHGDDPEYLAHHFGVSVATLKIALAHLRS